jgi:hypothetical protein
MPEILPITELTLEQVNIRFKAIDDLIKQYVPFMYTGSYIGDGSRLRRYTNSNINFTPKLVMIFTVLESNEYHVISIITDSTKLISTGFIVDDYNLSNNSKSVTYNYVAFGQRS